MFDKLLQFWHLSPIEMITSFMGLFLYWIPLVICLLGYLAACIANYRDDLYKRQTSSYYKPSLTLGLILGRVLLSVIPGVNLIDAALQHLPPMLAKFFEIMGSWLDFPLVPDTLVHEQERKAAIRDLQHKPVQSWNDGPQ